VTRFSTKNEAIARVVIDQILISAISEENDAALKGLKVLQSNELQLEDGSIPSTPVRAGQNQPEPAQLSLEFETSLSAPVMHNGVEKTLAGYADYTLFYKCRTTGNELTTLSASLVVVEAKRHTTTDSATAQLISYMGEFNIPLILPDVPNNDSNNPQIESLGIKGQCGGFWTCIRWENLSLFQDR
jgi:hypothetical protein